MKKIKKTHIIFFIILLLLSVLVFKKFNFKQPIPDVVELPKEIQESIKNLKPQKYVRIPILLYHYVEYVKDEGDTIRKSLNITPYTFEQEIKTLKDAGYKFITLADLANFLDNKSTLPAKPVILTFDDGYRDFYTDVFPILKKYQVKVTVYVVPNFLNKPNNLDTWQIKEMIVSNLVEVGSHTMNHAYLSDLPLARVKYEVEESKKYLEKSLRISVTTFAYPNGTFDNQVIDVVKKAGYRTAVTTINGIFAQDINRFFLYRIRPGARTGQSLLNIIH